MEGADTNPFADPFKDGSVTQATQASNANNASLEDYNPFSESNSGAIQPNQSSMMQPTDPPPFEADYGATTEKSFAPEPAPVIPGHEELLRRQEELERKAEELQRREQQLSSGNFTPKQNNWPPLPSWFPISPCFYQDFSVDIPIEFQRIVKMLYYLWIYYSCILFTNMIVSLVVFASPTKDSNNTSGQLFGLSILWWVLFTPCSLCWYRPAYKAFRSDSSFNFFFFFFVMFFQACWSILMAVGPSIGAVGWIEAISQSKKYNAGVNVIMFLQAVLFTVMATASVILLKRVHTLYRTTGASFEKAQQEFATGVMKNPGVQSAAKTAATAAAQSQFESRNP